MLEAVPDRFKHVVAAIFMLPEAVLITKPLDDIHRMFYDPIQQPRHATVNIAMVVDERNEKKEIICFGCHQPGHYRNKCPDEKKQENNTAELQRKTTQPNRACGSSTTAENQMYGTICYRLK